MPDLHKSILATETAPAMPEEDRRVLLTMAQRLLDLAAPARRPLATTRAASASSSSESPLASLQSALCDLVAGLERLDQRLAAMARGGGREITACNEVLGVVECVRAELLADAIATLRAAAGKTASELYRDAAERLSWRLDELSRGVGR